MNTGVIEVVNSNIYVPFVSASNFDMVVRTDNNSQRMFIGTGSNTVSAITICSNLVGIGSLKPRTALHISSNISNTALLTLQNTQGGNNTATTAIDFMTYVTNYTQAQLSVVESNYSGSFIFSTKTPGADANAMTEKMRVLADGNLVLYGTFRSSNSASVSIVAPTGFTGDGAGIINMSAANITTGTLPVARGGTGTTTSTGTGSLVLSASPTFTGTVTAATINATLLQTSATTRVDSTGALQNVTADASIITTGTLPVTRGGTGTTTSTGTGSLVLSAAPTFTGTVTAATINATTLQQNSTAVSLSGHSHDASAISTGTLPVARGGTGTSTSTGTGNVVLSADPTFTGTVTAATLTATTLKQGTTAVSLSGHTHDTLYNGPYYARIQGDGNFVVVGNVSWATATNSDKRLKQNIKMLKVDDLLTLLSKLDPVSFEWKDKYQNLKTNKDLDVEKGFIAQDIEKYIPELISKTYTNYVEQCRVYSPKELHITSLLASVGIMKLIESKQRENDELLAYTLYYNVNMIKHIGKPFRLWVIGNNTTIKVQASIIKSNITGYFTTTDQHSNVCTVEECNFKGVFVHKQKPLQKLVRKHFEHPKIAVKTELVPKKTVKYNNNLDRYIEYTELEEVKTENVLYEEVDIYDENGDIIRRDNIPQTICYDYDQEVNVVDSDGNIIWVDDIDADGNVVTELIHAVRYIDGDGNIINETVYNDYINSGKIAYCSQLVLCTCS